MTCTEVIHPHGFRNQAGCTEAQDPDVVKGKLHMASALTMYHAGKERRKLGWGGGGSRQETEISFSPKKSD